MEKPAINNQSSLQSFVHISNENYNQLLITAILKVTFRYLNNKTACFAEEQHPIAEWDEYNDVEKPGSIRIESDLAPL